MSTKEENIFINCSFCKRSFRTTDVCMNQDPSAPPLYGNLIAVICDRCARDIVLWFDLEREKRVKAYYNAASSVKTDNG